MHRYRPQSSRFADGSRAALKALTIYVGGALSFVLVALLALSFAPDESTRPEAIGFETYDNSLPAKQNGALYALGIADPGDAHDAGSRYVAEYQSIINKALQDPAYVPQLPAPDFGRVPAFKPPCELTKAQCIQAFRAASAEVTRFQEQHEAYLKRYATFKTYSVFRYTLRRSPDSQYVGFLQGILGASRFEMVRIGHDLTIPERRDAAISQLASEARLWRAILQDADNITDKLIAAGFVRRQARLVSEWLTANPQLASAYRTQLAAVTEPLNKQQFDFYSSFVNEYRDVADVLPGGMWSRSTPKSGNLASRFGERLLFAVGYKRQATLNRFHEILWEALRRSRLDAAELLALQLVRYSGAAANFKETDIFFTTNPVGSVLASRAVMNWDNYTLRLHDLDAFLRLVDAQRLILAKRVPPTDVEAFLNQLGDGHLDPYTRKPMAWNASTKTLSVQSHAHNAKDLPPAELTISY